MRIEKILNNNVVVTRDKLNREMIVMGKGLAFKKKIGDAILEAGVDKEFHLTDDRLSRHFQKLAEDIPMEYLELSYEIIEYTKEKLDVTLNESIYISLTDHLYNAIKRYKTGVGLPNVLLYDIKQLFPREYQIGKKTIERVHHKYGFDLSENEAGFIALHLVNAQSEQDSMNNMYQFTKTIQDILNIVRYYYQTPFDEESIYFFRFVTHLRFFLSRVMNTSLTQEGEVEEELIQMIQRKYQTASGCVDKIAIFLQETFNYHMSDDEIVYLTIHLARLADNNHLKNH